MYHYNERSWKITENTDTDIPVIIYFFIRQKCIFWDLRKNYKLLAGCVKLLCVVCSGFKTVKLHKVVFRLQIKQYYLTYKLRYFILI